jgi:bacterioferritin-associated ferredoxin
MVRKVVGAVAGGDRIALLRPDSAPGDALGSEASSPKAAPLAPGILVWAAELASVSPTDETTKRCARCGQSVARDTFRAKEGAGYLCGECRNDAREQVMRTRTRLEKWLQIAIACLLIGAVTTAFIYGGTALLQQVDTRTRRK